MPDPLVFPIRGGFESDDPYHVANLRTLEIWARNLKPAKTERFNAAALTYTNLVGPTEISTNDRFMADLTGYTEVRLLARVLVAGSTGVLRAYYSTDGTAFNPLSADIALGTTGLKASAWAAIPTAAKTVVQIALEGVLGNGTEDPQVASGVSLEWR